LGGKHVGHAELCADKTAGHDTRSGTGLDCADGILASVLNTEDAAVGLHDQRLAAQAFGLEQSSEALQIRGDLRTHVSIERRGRRTLIFSEKRRHFTGKAEINLRVALLDEVPQRLLLRVTGE